jgi:myo-inositol-1(or 4)-monophosphatase
MGQGLPVGRFKDLLDARAQEAIVGALKGAPGPLSLVSEEGDLDLPGAHILVADPVDGTTNLARGLPPAAVSLSVSESAGQSGVLAGLVMDGFTGETFYAELGKGATRDGETLRTNASVGLKGALVSMDISKAPRLEKVGPLLETARHLRALGCSAMALCRVASGTLDAHVDMRGMIRATDVSAGLFILKEAGGVYALNGRLFGEMALKRDARVDLVAAGSRELMEEIQALLAQG